jgi:hypothetical protein
MLSATSLSRLPEFRCLLGLCLAGALSSCAMEPAGGEDGVSSQVTEAASEANWFDLGYPTDRASDLSVSVYSATEPDIWVTGSDGQVWNRTISTGWSPAQINSGVTLYYVAASRRGNSTDLVAADSMQRVWTNTRDGGGHWTGWVTVGTTVQKSNGKPALSTVTGSDRLDVWVRGTDDELYHAYRFGPPSGTKWNGSGWTSEGAPPGKFQCPLSAYTRSASPLTIDLVACGYDAGVGTKITTWARAYQNGWLPWGKLGMDTKGSPNVMASSSGLINVVGIGTGTDDTAIVHTLWTGSSWVNLGGMAPLPYKGHTGYPVFIYEGGNANKWDLFIRGSTKNVLRFIH